MAEFNSNQRAIILQYRFVDKLSYPEIARRVAGVTEGGARQFCHRTQKRAKSSDITTLLQYKDALPRSGRPRRVEPGSQASIRIREAVRGPLQYHKQDEAANFAFERVREGHTTTPRQPLGTLNAKQVHNITQGALHSQADSIDIRPITRKRALEKPGLLKLNMRDRKRYIEFILSLDPDKTVLIGCDETPLEFGGSGHTHVSAPRGIVVYADEASDPRFSKMQWDAAATDTRIKRPCIVWNREEQQETEVLMQKLAHQNHLLQARVEHNRQEASKPGTPQYQYLISLNEAVAAYNATVPHGQKKGRKQKVSIERAFKMEKLERDAKKGGLDFVWYAFNIYENVLFNYYRQLRDLNPGKDVYIIEDNVGVHHKARRLLADQIQEFDIKFVDTPANSPDLHPIEHLHKDQKKELERLRMCTTSAAAAVRLYAEREMIRVWRDSATFEAKVQERFSIRYFKGLAQRSKDATPSYSNRYKDSL
jgi:hypothetical protein